LPELTDEWVKENTEWDDIDAMRDAILSQMRTMKIVEAQTSQRDAVLMALSELVSEEAAPEVLVNGETVSGSRNWVNASRSRNSTSRRF